MIRRRASFRKLVIRQALLRSILACATVMLVVLEIPLFKESHQTETFNYQTDLLHPSFIHTFTQNNLLLNRQEEKLFDCSKNNRHTECCAAWDIQGDDWWLQNPDYEVSLENDTHYCFAPIQNPQKASFLREINAIQWHGNCDEVERSVEVNSGYGASIIWLVYAFWHAHLAKKPFQIVQNNRRWLYATDNASSWAYCESEDSRCYFLPISSCTRNESIKGEHQETMPRTEDEEVRTYWLKEYLFRPRQHYRYRTYHMRQHVKLQFPCTTVHVRRGDSGLPRRPWRRYAAVQEYIEAGHIEPGDNIMLLTDDQSTIQEIKRYHPHYNWMYVEKPRQENIKNGWESHIPSGDEGLEMLTIYTEYQLASSCQKIVHGRSGYMKAIVQKMKMEGRNFSRYVLDTTVKQESAEKFGGNRAARVASFFHEIEQKYNSTP